MWHERRPTATAQPPHKCFSLPFVSLPLFSVPPCPTSLYTTHRLRHTQDTPHTGYATYTVFPLLT
jgi:hypothetical protein